MDDLLRRVRENVRLVVEQLGPLSGLDFGLDRESVAWVEGFVERQRARPDFDPETIDGLVNTLGSFLGECIAANAGGEWRWSEQQQSLGVALPGDSFAFPFAKVRKQLEHGLEEGESILSFYDVAVSYVAKGRLTSGRVEALWIKRARRGPMDAVGEAEMVAGSGLVGNADRGGRRQVTLLDAAVWDRVTASLGANLDPSARRANVLLRGVDLRNSRGRVLWLGPCRVRIFNETKPCERMDEALPGLKDALYTDWGGGAYGEVVEGGTVRVGDAAGWEDA